VNKQRRLIIKGSVASAALGTAIAAGLISPARVLAASKLQPAFEAKSPHDVLASLFPGDRIETSDAINIKAPDIAENGAVVPVTVSSSMAGIETISILVSQNATPLVASFDLTKDADAFVSTRIKMGKTSDVVAVAKVGDKLYRASREVKVTIGGCGG
jgi:sulfur-oxidizing protein SoxY